jgi:hypothetical protein
VALKSSRGGLPSLTVLRSLPIIQEMNDSDDGRKEKPEGESGDSDDVLADQHAQSVPSPGGQSLQEKVGLVCHVALREKSAVDDDEDYGRSRSSRTVAVN